MFGQRQAVPSGTVRWGLADAALVLLGAQLLGFVWAGAVVVGVHGTEAPVPELSIAVAVIANIGLWLGYGGGTLATSRSKGGGVIADLGARFEALDIPVGLAAGVALQLAVLPALYWPILRLVDGDPSEAARTLLGRVDGPFDWLVLCLSVVVMAPLIEELFYRGLLLRALEHRVGPVVAVAASSLVFAVVHRQLLPLPGLFVFGAAAAIVTLATGRIGTAWAMHVGFNATTLVVLGTAG